MGRYSTECPPLRALSIRQPYAELILRGIKTIEYRSRGTKIVGERFWIYAPLRQAQDIKVWSRNLTAQQPPPWIGELANAMKLFGAVECLTGGIGASAGS